MCQIATCALALAQHIWHTLLCDCIALGKGATGHYLSVSAHLSIVNLGIPPMVATGTFANQLRKSNCGPCGHPDWLIDTPLNMQLCSMCKTLRETFLPICAAAVRVLSRPRLPAVRGLICPWCLSNRQVLLGGDVHCHDGPAWSTVWPLYGEQTPEETQHAWWRNLSARQYITTGVPGNIGAGSHFLRSRKICIDIAWYSSRSCCGG